MRTVVVALPRRVVVGTYCNKSSISLILIGNSVVVVLIFSVVGERVVGLIILFPRLQAKQNRAKDEENENEK